MLAHCSSSPSIFVGTPKEKGGLAKELKGESPALLSWASVGTSTVVNEGPETIVLNFKLPFTIRISYAERVLRMGFSTADSGIKSLRILCGADPREKLFGAGPSSLYNLKAKEVEIGLDSATGSAGREPAVFSSSGAWMYVDGSGILRWSFRSSRTLLFCSTIPKEIAIGFGKSTAMAMDLLSHYRALRHGGVDKGGLRIPIPKEYQGGVIVDASAFPGNAGACVEAIRGAGVNPAWLVSGQAGEGESGNEGEREQALPTVSAGEWKRILASSSVHSMPIPDSGRKSVREHVRRVLSLSFSGNGHVFFPIGGTEGGKSVSLGGPDIARLLDVVMFSPLFVVDTGTELAGNALRHAFARAAAVYGALGPYRDFCSEWWVREGIPAFCNPVLYYPDETDLWKLDDQYMFGPDMMIAPSSPEDTGARRLQLPDDAWIHLWTSRRYSKGSVAIDAPAGKPAVFYRAESSFAKLFDTVRRMATRL